MGSTGLTDKLFQESYSAVEARPRLEKQIADLRAELERLKNGRKEVSSWKSSTSSSSDDEYGSSVVSRAKEEAGKNKKLLLQTQQELKVRLMVN